MKRALITVLLATLSFLIPATEAAAVLIVYNSDGSCKFCLGSAAACKEACGSATTATVAAGANQMVSMPAGVFDADTIEVSDLTLIADGLYQGHVVVTHQGQIIADEILSLDEVTVIDLDAGASNVANDLILVTEQCD